MTTEQIVPTPEDILKMLSKVGENNPETPYIFNDDVQAFIKEMITMALVALEEDIPSDSAFEGVFMGFMMGFEAGRDFERGLAFQAAFPISEDGQSGTVGFQ